MNVWTPTNQSRVDKIVDLLDKLAVSKAANKADDGTMMVMMAPVTGKLAELTGPSSPSPVGMSDTAAPSPVEIPDPTTHWAAHIETARTMPLNQAVEMMQIIATRVEQELYEKGSKS